MLLLVALVCTVSFRAVTAALEDGDDGVDRMYGDIAGMPIPLQANDKPSVCSKMCDSEQKCVCWAYSKANCSGDGAVPMCYLKEKVMPQSLNRCRVRVIMMGSVVTWAIESCYSGVRSEKCNFVAVCIQTITHRKRQALR